MRNKIIGERKMTKNKVATTIALILMLAMTISLVATPFANAQPALIMNLPGAEGVPHTVLTGTGTDIDLNGGPGPDEPIELWVKYPGRTEFTYIDTYTTAGNGDLDVYDFDFN